jgi:hypothetical protein
MNSWIDLHALWKIVVVGLLAGAGLPALFAVGLRALSAGPHGVTLASVDDDRIYGGSVPGLIVASLCFAVVLAAIGLGIYSIVAGS